MAPRMMMLTQVRCSEVAPGLQHAVAFLRGGLWVCDLNGGVYGTLLRSSAAAGWEEVTRPRFIVRRLAAHAPIVKELSSGIEAPKRITSEIEVRSIRMRLTIGTSGYPARQLRGELRCARTLR